VSAVPSSTLIAHQAVLRSTADVGEPMSGDYLMLEVMNFGSAAPNLSLVPEGASAGGLFDVVLVDDRHRIQLIDDLPLYRFGRHECAVAFVDDSMTVGLGSGHPAERSFGCWPMAWPVGCESRVCPLRGLRTSWQEPWALVSLLSRPSGASM
jgi:hypothetical protein